MLLNALLSSLLSLVAEVVDLFLEVADLVTDTATIRFEFCFTGAASANTARKS